MRPSRFLVGTVDWSVAELSRPEAHEETARRLLHAIIADCRSDGELSDVAIGARYGASARLIALAGDLISEEDVEMRARGARLCGWLPGCESRLEELAAKDSSLWVRRVAASALDDRKRERFARHWWRRFLGGGSREERWGAAQLFFACVDAASPGWLWDALAGERGRTHAR